MKTDSFFAKYKPHQLAHAPKHVILRETLIAAIQDGHWKCGDRLPTELQLTTLTPYSLGTVQRAVQALVVEGFITRKQGRGSFVAPVERRIGGPWLFRFLSVDGADFASMSTRVIARRKVSGSAPWFTWLTMGHADRKLLEIDRLVHVGDAMIFNRVYVDPERFPVIASTSLRELHGVNFAGIIQATYNLPIRHMAHTAQCAQLPEAACRAIGVPPGSYGLVLEIAASAGRTRPVSYQQLFVPADAGKFFISDTFTRWIGAALPLPGHGEKVGARGRRAPASSPSPRPPTARGTGGATARADKVGTARRRANAKKPG